MHQTGNERRSGRTKEQERKRRRGSCEPRIGPSRNEDGDEPQPRLVIVTIGTMLTGPVKTLDVDRRNPEMTVRRQDLEEQAGILADKIPDGEKKLEIWDSAIRASGWWRSRHRNLQDHGRDLLLELLRKW